MNPESYVVGVSEADNALQGVPQTGGGDVTLGTVFGFFNIVAGLMIVAAFIMFFGGFIGYITRLGLEGRNEGIVYMQWGVTILFVLILILAAIRYVQENPTVVFILIGLAVLGLIAYLAATAMRGGGEEEEH